MITEKGLAEKVMFCIYIDSDDEVEQAFNDYSLFYRNLKKGDKDNNLYSRICKSYSDYNRKKIRGEIRR